MTNAKLSPGKMLLLGFQHVFAMFGATVLVPTLTGLSVSATLLFAGLGTLLFHLLTKRKVPAFLGSSFAFLGGYAAVKELVKNSGTGANWIPYAGIGVACAGLLYRDRVRAVQGLWPAIRSCGFFPPVVTGPIIICHRHHAGEQRREQLRVQTGWIAILAVAIVVVVQYLGQGHVQDHPHPAGRGRLLSCVAALCGQVDFTKVHEAAWIGLPFDWKDTTFQFDGQRGRLVGGLCYRHDDAHRAGDHDGAHRRYVRDFLDRGARTIIADPGLHRSLLGDGLATTLAALFGAPANTTYGENTGVLALTKVYDPRVVRLAACIAVVFSFCPKFAALVSCMPSATIGGVSLILYGMISAVGVRNVVENQVDFTKSRNVIIAALIMSLSLGINFSKAGAIKFALGSIDISLSGLAVASLVGILLNAILPGNDYVFGANSQGDTSVNFKV